MKHKNAFNIPNTLESLRTSVKNGEITILQATEELCKAGWMNYIDEAKAKRLLGI